MSLHRFNLAAVAVFLIPAAPALATDLGDDAPPLKIEKWIKGGPVDLAAGKGKNVYVVEFWATSHGACRATIPHLTGLQRRLKDKNVVIIGVSTDVFPKNRQNVEPFVKRMGARMEYVVALDTSDGATGKAYREPLGNPSVPYAFVIDTQGKLVWHGQTYVGLTEVLDAVLSGKYDIKSLAEISKKVEEDFRKVVDLIGKYGAAARKTTDVKALAAQGQQIMELGHKNAMLMNQFAWIILEDREITARDLALALRAAKAAYDASEGVDIAVLDTYARALFGNGKVKEAIEIQKKAIKLAAGDEERRQSLEQTLKRYQAADEK